MTDKVSIIVPVHNAGEYIEKTYASIQNQTYENWELILVENGSTDNTVEVISSLKDDRICFLQPVEAKNAATARNAGVKKSTGRYVAFLDADDLWVPDKLEKQLAFMEEKKAGFCFTGYEFGDEQANPTGKIVRVPETINYKKALSNTTIFTSTVIFDTTKIPRDEIQMPDVKSEDTALWWQILRGGVLGYGLDENLVTYRRPKKSLSSNKFEAIKRIWNLYRRCEHFNVFRSAYHMVGWAFRAVKRRV